MRTQRLLVLLFALVLALAGAASFAQDANEPTVDDIYKAATSGNLTGARSMVDQVIARHPNSAKAHYVKAEIAARQRDAAVARTELQIADKLAPGLPFARPEAVSALRAQVDRLSQPAPPARSVVPAPVDARRMPAQAPPRSDGGFPMGGLLLLAVIAIAGFLFWRSRRRPAASPPPQYPPPPQSPSPGLDTQFGRYDAGMPSPGYGSVPQAAPSLGSTLGRGLATGLAVGAGAVVAQEIGRRILDHEGRPVSQPPHEGASAADSPLARDAGLGALTGESRTDPNPAMGGEDFGIADNRGWDDAGGEDFGLDNGGDDWNN